MKQVRKLKHKLLRDIRSTSGLTNNIYSKEEKHQFECAKDHFKQTEKSLARVQQALIQWAGALDAFSVSTRNLAEELVAHTLLVSRPSDPTQHGTLDSDTTKFCRALQNIMSLTEQVAKPVHNVFVESCVRPVLEATQVDVPEINQELAKMRKLEESKSSAARKSLRQDKNQKPVDASSLSEMPTVEEHCAEPHKLQIYLQSRKCVKKLERFRTNQIQTLKGNIGGIVACNYQFASRSADVLEQMIPIFPAAACISVDIAYKSSLSSNRGVNRDYENSQDDDLHTVDLLDNNKRRSLPPISSQPLNTLDLDLLSTIQRTETEESDDPNLLIPDLHSPHSFTSMTGRDSRADSSDGIACKGSGFATLNEQFRALV